MTTSEDSEGPPTCYACGTKLLGAERLCEDCQPREALIDAAVAAARQSTCEKSKRGVAILPLGGTPADIITANNSPASPFYCDGSPRCREFCRRLTVHAEQRALLMLHGQTAIELLHIKVVDGLPVPSGPPSCYECSKLILEMNVGIVWLLHKTGWRGYDNILFHELSLAHHGLPQIRRPEDF